MNKISKHTKKISTKRKRKIKLQLIQQQINDFIDGKTESDDIICYWCGDSINEDEITLDHVIELNNGGSWYDLNNLVLSCRTCNNLRSNNLSKFNIRINS